MSCPGSMELVEAATYTYWLTAPELKLGDLVLQYHPVTGQSVGWFPVVFTQRSEQADGAFYVRIALPPELYADKIPAFFHLLPKRQIEVRREIPRS